MTWACPPLSWTTLPGLLLHAGRPAGYADGHRRPLTAYEVVNTWPQEELRRILYEYGEERYAPAIAKAIVRARETAPVKTTLELVEIIKGHAPRRSGRSAPRQAELPGHPHRRQRRAGRPAPYAAAAVDGLNPGGRLAVITFHSLEDRIVKRTLAEQARGCTCPPEFPVCVCGKKPRIRLVNRKPITADQAELADNPAPQRQTAGGGEVRSV